MEIELTDEEYSSYVKWLKAITAEEMEKVQGNREGQTQALLRYWKRCDLAGLGPAEAIDYLGVDYGSILDYAGYDEDEQMAVMEMSDALDHEVEVPKTPLPEGDRVLPEALRLRGN